MFHFKMHYANYRILPCDAVLFSLNQVLAVAKVCLLPRNITAVSSSPEYKTLGLNEFRVTA
jgi:hypothetical protein